MNAGPLKGIKIIEFAGIGPGPFCGMLLADMGADVLRIDRKGSQGSQPHEIYNRNRRSLALDLKNPKSIEICLSLISKADALQEGFRPGVMERLGLGPDICLARNARLVYGRMTGWGQTGPLAQAAGHDINYIALSGALASIGDAGRKPAVPLNLVGDFGGGALYLAMGICAALLEAKTSGQGQVVDCAMTDGAASLMAMFYGFRHTKIWQLERGSNLLDGGAHFYDCYETKDGKYIALGSIEPQFYALLREKLRLQDADFDKQMDRTKWAALKPKIAAAVKQKTQKAWDDILSGTDVCYAPVLSLDEAPEHPHNKARQTFVTYDGIVQPAPAPRFSRTPGKIHRAPVAAGLDNQEVLADWGIAEAQIKQLESAGGI